MFIREIRQTLMLITISILFVMGTTIMFSSLGCTILMVWICKKSFFCTIFHIINVLPWNESDLDTYNNLHSFCYGHYNHALLIGIHDIDLQEKLFSLIFHIIKVHPWNESNLDTRKNLYSFRYGHYNHVLLTRIHDINALDLQEKFSFHHFS